MLNETRHPHKSSEVAGLADSEVMPVGIPI
jgi:hypothetical protein